MLANVRFIPVCIRSWILQVHKWLKRLLQVLHACGFIFVCVLSWPSQLETDKSLKGLLQCLYGYGFTSVQVTASPLCVLVHVSCNAMIC